MGTLLGLVLALLAEAARVMLGPNLNTAVPGKVYRVAQLSPDGLERVFHQKGIRTIVNFRGCCAPTEWYVAEARTAHLWNVSLVDIPCSAGRLPATYSVRQFIEVLDHAEYPLLLHCHQGIDRTGWGSAVAAILLADASLEEARSQLSLRYLHLPWGKTGQMDRFFDLYEEWLQRAGKTHSAMVFRHWALHEYTAGACMAEYELLEPGPWPLRVPRGKPFPVRVRIWNRSSETWHFHPANQAGVHVWFLVLRQRDRLHPQMERAGLFHAEVPPGGKIDLTLPIRSLNEPGRYTLRVDMLEELHAEFLQAGCEPLYVELEVP
jgi:undecaprenyl-diphosphatase